MCIEGNVEAVIKTMKKRIFQEHELKEQSTEDRTWNVGEKEEPGKETSDHCYMAGEKQAAECHGS